LIALLMMILHVRGSLIWIMFEFKWRNIAISLIDRTAAIFEHPGQQENWTL